MIYIDHSYFLDPGTNTANCGSISKESLCYQTDQCRQGARTSNSAAYDRWAEHDKGRREAIQRCWEDVRLISSFQIHDYILLRFVLTPRPTMEKELKAQEKELTEDINSLNKKVRGDR